ncbi:MAG: type CRISPR-associated protein Cas5/CasD [Pseudomonadota bacterium]
MTAFLLASLYAPLASWGDITVGERRTTWDRPSRSAVLGLLAAALGLTRDDQAAHDALDASLGFAVRVDAPGKALVDYQTAQTLPQTEMKRSGAGTRRAMITHGEAVNGLETILSRRELRVDAAYTLAFWVKSEGQPRWSLHDLKNALNTPVFTLYAGRKANPLGCPLRPEVGEYETLADAFAGRKPVHLLDGYCGLGSRGRKRLGGGELSVSSDVDPKIALGFPEQRRETRRDASPNRTRWQFANRAVSVGSVPVPKG